MSWKERIKLSDLPQGTRIEICCKCCGKFRFMEVGQIKPWHYVRNLHLDEFEASRICHAWGCGGDCRVALPAQSDTEGFQGGLA